MLRLSTRSHGICGTARTPTNAFAARSGAEVSREELAHRAKPTVSRFPRCETYGFALPFLTSQLPVRLEQAFVLPPHSGPMVLARPSLRREFSPLLALARDEPASTSKRGVRVPDFAPTQPVPIPDHVPSPLRNSCHVSSFCLYLGARPPRRGSIEWWRSDGTLTLLGTGP